MDGGWIPLSTCPQSYCNPVLHEGRGEREREKGREKEKNKCDRHIVFQQSLCAKLDKSNMPNSRKLMYIDIKGNTSYRTQTGPK